MTKKELEKFIKFLEKKKYQVHNFLSYNGRIPDQSLKEFFIPPCQTLFKSEKEVLPKTKKQVLFGVNSLDLKAFLLWDQVFAHDPYYQTVLKNTIIVGHSLAPKKEEDFHFFIATFAEETLEHLRFDIYLCRQTKNKYKIFTGSEDGQRLLDAFGFSHYEHCEFVGPIREEGMDAQTKKIRTKLSNRYVAEIWEELGKRCLECGKCSYVCPTCYCFDLREEEGKKLRCWADCFQHEFSQVAGGYKFLPSTAQRIYFWYYHKFVRDPDNYNMPGCVGCGRCIKACPVGIDIRKVLAAILKS